MPPELLAVVAATCFGLSHIAAKRGLQTTSVSSGLLPSLGAAWLVITAVVAADPPDRVTLGPTLAFAAAGLLAPGLSRWASTTGIDRLGASVAVPIQSGTRPLLATAGGVLLLSETLTAVQLAGLAGIVAGGWYLSRERADGAVPLADRGDGRSSLPRARSAVLFPISAALCYSSADIILKRALGSLSAPAFGAMVSTTTALVAWSVASIAVPRLRRSFRLPRHGAVWLAASGALIGVAIVTLFHALARANVTVVVPIMGSQPLIVVLLSAVLLRDMERVGPGIVLAGAAIVAGTILISLG